MFNCEKSFVVTLRMQWKNCEQKEKKMGRSHNGEVREVKVRWSESGEVRVKIESWWSE